MYRKQSVLGSVVAVTMVAWLVTGCAASGGNQVKENPIEDSKVYENKDMNYIFDEDENAERQIGTEQDVLAALNDNPALDVSGINVICTNGVVTLRGAVDSALERELAGRIAAKVEGVREVRNLILSQS